jgi:hypothetical protein
MLASRAGAAALGFFILSQSGERPEAGGGRGLGTSYLSTTDTVTLTSDTPAILTMVPETWTVNWS